MSKTVRRMARPPYVDGSDNANTDAAAPSDKPATKQSLVLDLLKQEGGTSLDAIVEATGWQPHTTRAALTGLRKKGHAIRKDKIDGVTRYAILPVAGE
jgi:hypothetical protein